MNQTRLELPERMKAQLTKFQRRIWTVKLIEGVCAALFGLLISYLAVFALDRFFDTTASSRWLILLIGTLGLAIWLPWVCHRWIWRSRRLEQVARMLKVNHPRLGDYLLGIIELVHNNDFEGTSESLCRAALAQADRETADKDFTDSVPHPRHRRWALVVAVPLLLAVAALLIVPAAGSNALQRWLMPWQSIDRYTFTQLETLPTEIVIPIAEQTNLAATLAETSRWNPDSGAAWVGDQQIQTTASDRKFEFGIPPLSTSTDVKLRIGDVRETIKLDPQPRPELSALSAAIELPAYLQRTEPVQREIRGGSLSTVAGSTVAITAVATRALTSAMVDGQPVSVHGSTIVTDATLVNDSQVLEMAWRDGFGLTAKTPLKLRLRTADDESPTLNCRELERQRVIMERDVLAFEMDAADDYGIKSVGMEWSGTPAATSPDQPAKGEKIIQAGNPAATALSAMTATFSPQRESIAPQTIQLRLFVEDYLPDRERVYSPAYTVFVLSEDEHAIWMTRRLDEWFKQSLETYEREQQLYQRNVELRNLPAAELDRPETRRKIEAQATAENAQARRLEALTNAGELLVKEAARNENFGVDHLEKLAEMIQQLKDIHSNRMPSVADLLKQASSAAANPGPSAPAGKPNSVADAPKNPGQSEPKSSSPPIEAVPKAQPDSPPSVSLKESNMNAPDEKQPPESPAATPAPPKPAALKLPSVTLDALPGEDDEEPAACPAGDKLESAVAAQEELLAEFQKVAEELQKLISNLEGSTFVKRLKALSRYELVIANDVNESTLTGFGEMESKVADATRTRTELLAKRQRAYVETTQHIEDDLAAYLTRNPDGKYQTVLSEMRKLEAVKQVNLVADRLLANEPGTSIAHAEMLADTFDRWAEQLVGPG